MFSHMIYIYKHAIVCYCGDSSSEGAGTEFGGCDGVAAKKRKKKKKRSICRVRILIGWRR